MDFRGFPSGGRIGLLAIFIGPGKMSYQVTMNSRNVLVPVSLEARDGMRLDAPPSRLDTATAMVVTVTADGAFSQEFIPLRIMVDPVAAYAGLEWELRAQKAGRDHYVFYVGIPDRCFAAGSPDEPKSISVQVVGTSAMTGREDYSGGADVALTAEAARPPIPGFLNLVERFFPTLLPGDFIAGHTLAGFRFGGRRDLVLMASLQAGPAERLPVSFGKHWDPKNWIGAVVENLGGPDRGRRGAYHLVRGGCFLSRNCRVTHWFGGGIGLEERGFRQAAGEMVRGLGPAVDGAWVFWLDSQDGKPAAAPEPAGYREGAGGLSIRHPLMHRILRRASVAAGAAPASIAMLPAEQAVAALERVARILADHPAELHRARTEPAHADWSGRLLDSPAAAVAGALAAAEDGRPAAADSGPAADLPSLGKAIRELYREHGEVLRSLESAFDEAGGYAAWDAPFNPVRDRIAAYLSESQEARSPA
jgi:hypothetical protein